MPAIIILWKQLFLFSKVYTTQPVVGEARGIHVDRRRYNVGEIAICKTSDSTAFLGKVLESFDEKLKLCVLRKERLQYIPTAQEETVNMTSCLPGTFSLTKSGSLPQHVKTTLNNHGLKL